MNGTMFENLKRCTRCRELKSLDQFSKHYYCKQCMHEYYIERKARLGRQFLDSNKESVARWAEGNREQYLETCKRASKKWKENNTDHNAALKLYYNQIRRARLAQVQVDTSITIEALFNRDEGVCQICLEACLRQEASIDHVIPLRVGGDHVWENVQLAHLICNFKKGGRYDDPPEDA